MIKIKGTAQLEVPYEVELDMTEEDFDGLTTRQQNRLLDENIDWYNTLRNAEPTDFEVDELEEVNNG